MTVAEQGLVLVSASSDYTITLPTAVGNTGLTYKFKKTDANYNCITLDGNGSETINYENADGVPKETYARLNTYGAEVTVVSDGSNWQVINEAMGQVPECWAYLGSNQLDLTHSTWIKVLLDAESYDIGSNFANYKFTAPISGKYFVNGKLSWVHNTLVADERYIIAVYKNGASISTVTSQASSIAGLTMSLLSPTQLTKDDYLELYAYQDTDVDTCDIQSGSALTSLIIELVSKE